MTEKPEGEVMPTEENKPTDTPFREGSPLDNAMAEALHPEPSADPEAAKHGARKFSVRFADASVMKALDTAAAPGAVWCVSVSAIIPGDVGEDGRPVIRHDIMASERFPILDLPSCAQALADYAFKRIPLEHVGEAARKIADKAGQVFRDRQKRAEIGLFGTGNEAPETFADQQD